MKKLKIEITKASLTGFHVRFREDGQAAVTCRLSLLTEQEREVTTHELSTHAWKEEDKFTLPIVMIDPIQRIAAALEEVIVRSMREGQLALNAPRNDDEAEEMMDDVDFDPFGLEYEVLDYPLDLDV